MADPIRQTHILFEEHFGTNMREWPENAQALKAAVNSHLSRSLAQAQERGRQEGQDQVHARLMEFLDQETS